MEKYMKVTLAILGLCLVVFGVSGCEKITQEELDEAINQAILDGAASVDITLDNEQAATEAVDEYIASLPIEETTESTEEEVVELLLYSEEYFLTDDVEADLDNKLDLFDGEIEFDDNDYDVSEHLVFTKDAKFVSSRETNYKEFEENPYLVLEKKDAIAYEYRFDDVIDIDDIKDSEPLEITFLGQDLKIVDVDANGMTISSGKEMWMTLAQTDIFDGKSLTLINVGIDSAVISVDGEVTTIQKDNTKTVNGLEVTVSEVFYVDEKEDRMAEIQAGNDNRENIDNGDAYIGQDEDDAEWVWEVTVNGNDLETISVVYDQKRDDLDDDFAPLGLGEELKLPNDFLTVTFDEVSTPKYVKYELKKDGTNQYEIDSNDEEGFICGADEYSRVYVNITAGKFYDDDDYAVASEICNNPVLGDSEFSIKAGGNTIKLDGPKNRDFFNGANFQTNADFDRDETIMDSYGVIFENVEDWIQDHEDLTFEVPEEQLEVTIGVY